MADTQPSPTAKSKWGWRLLIGVSALLVLNGINLFFIEVARSDQRVAIFLAMVGLFALVLSIGGYRQRSSLAWSALWVLALTLALLGLHLLLGESTGLGVGYLSIAVIVVVGLLLARSGLRRLEPTAEKTAA